MVHMEDLREIGKVQRSKARVMPHFTQSAICLVPVNRRLSPTYLLRPLQNINALDNE